MSVENRNPWAELYRKQIEKALDRHKNGPVVALKDMNEQHRKAIETEYNSKIVPRPKGRNATRYHGEWRRKTTH